MRVGRLEFVALLFSGTTALASQWNTQHSTPHWSALELDLDRPAGEAAPSLIPNSS